MIEGHPAVRARRLISKSQYSTTDLRSALPLATIKSGNGRAVRRRGQVCVNRVRIRPGNCLAAATAVAERAMLEANCGYGPGSSCACRIVHTDTIATATALVSAEAAGVRVFGRGTELGHNRVHERNQHEADCGGRGVLLRPRAGERIGPLWPSQMELAWLLASKARDAVRDQIQAFENATKSFQAVRSDRWRRRSGYASNASTGCGSSTRRLAQTQFYGVFSASVQMGARR